MPMREEMTRHFQREMLTAVGLSAALTALMIGIGAIGAGLLAFSGWHSAFGGSGGTPTLELPAPAAPVAAPARPAALRPHRTPGAAPRAAARPRSGVVAAAPTRRGRARLGRRGHLTRHVTSKPAPAAAAPVASPRPVATPVAPAAATPRGRTTAGGNRNAVGRSHVVGRHGHSHGERHGAAAPHGRVNVAARTGRSHGDRHATAGNGGSRGERHGAAAPHGRVNVAARTGRSRGDRHAAAPRAQAPAPAGARAHDRGGTGGGRGHHH
jgi:hypothetical protein